jgi:hypothetical protein
MRPKKEKGGDRNQSLDKRKGKENPAQTKMLCFFVEFLFCSVQFEALSHTSVVE